MEIIAFQCASCGKTLKVKEDKVGMKTKCPQCGTPLTVPKSSTVGSPQSPASKAAAEKPAPAPPKPAGDDDDDDGGAYNLAGAFDTPPSEEGKRKRDDDDEEDDDEEEEERKPKKKVTRKKIKKKTVQFADQWRKVNVAVILVFSGMCIWGVNWLLHSIIIFMGLLDAPQYSSVAQRASESGKLNMVTFSVGLMAGFDHMDLGKTLFLIEQILGLVAAALFLVGYCISLGVPPRYGTRGQAIALVCLGTVNLLLDLILKLLPTVGAIGYTMVPLLVPEIVMSEADIERSIPLHAFWCASPFWETFAAILIQFMFFFEPILFCIFLRAVALSLKDDEWLEPQVLALVRLGFGQLFGLICFYMLSITGSSEVLHSVLMVAYSLWRCFFLGFIISFASTLIKTPARVTYMLGESEDTDRDDYDEEEDDEDD